MEEGAWQARPAVANEVASGETKPAYPGITVIPVDAIRIKSVADDELANGESTIFVGMTNLVAKPAERAEEA